MDLLRLLWHTLTLPDESDSDDARRAYMTRMVLVLIGVALLGFTLPVAWGWAILKAWDFGSVLIMLVADLGVVTALGLARRGHWRTSRFIPMLFFYVLALTGSLMSGLMTPLMVCYVPVILLAGALFGGAAPWHALGLCLVSYALGWRQVGADWTDGLPPFIMFSGTLVGTALVQQLAMGQLQRALGRARAYAARLQTEATERQRTEESLRLSEERWQFALEGSDLGVWDWDILTDHIVRSPRYAQMLGYTLDELGYETDSWVRLLHPDDLPRVLQTNEQHLQGPEALRENEFRLRHKDGSYRWIQARGKIVAYTPEGHPARMVGTHADITERKQQEEILRASEARYRLLVDNAPLGIISLDATGQVVDANSAIFAIMGTPPALDARAYNLLHHPPLVAAGIAQDFATCLQSGQPLVTEHLYTSSWGREAYLRMHLCALRDGQGQIVGMQALIEDILPTKRVEEQLRQAQKMEAVGQLAGGVAHDFNNLLTIINGYSQMLLQMLPQESDGWAASARADLGEILQAGRRAADLTRQLLAFSRKQMLEPRVLDLNAVLAGMTKMLGRLIGEDVQLVVKPDADLGRVRADPGQIEQVVLNLAVNARDAMPDGGVLTLATENVALRAEDLARDVEMQPGAYVRLVVRDTGMGMSPEVQAHLFEPFFTTKGLGKGTGLGLSTVYGIVKQSGGTIAVHSAPSEGTTFEISLPRVDEPVTEDDKALALPTGSETVLVVEDNAEVRALTVRLLRSLGYQVVEAPGGFEALSLSTRVLRGVHLMLTDVVMPEMNGRDLAEHMVRVCPEIKVLFMSGYAADTISQHGVPAQNVHYIQKPFTQEALARKVREVLG
jgi:two-component system, cell cycle sensor histidine kinase and response regulator CckA